MPTFEIASLGFLCLSTIAYVIFQIVSGGPFGSAESMVQKATAQKIIVIINVALKTLSLSSKTLHAKRYNK